MTHQELLMRVTLSAELFRHEAECLVQLFTYQLLLNFWLVFQPSHPLLHNSLVPRLSGSTYHAC